MEAERDDEREEEASGIRNSEVGIGIGRRNMRLIEGNEKCRHLKKLTCKRTLRQVFICLRTRTTPPPLLHTVYMYTYSHRGGGS
jgi:hypothetical protein